MLAVIQSLWELLVGRLCYLWTGYLGREISEESVLKAWTQNLDPALLKWSQHAGVDHLFQVFLPHTEALNHPCSGHLPVLFIFVSHSMCAFPCSGRDFSPTRCTSASERAEWREGNGSSFLYAVDPIWSWLLHSQGCWRWTVGSHVCTHVFCVWVCF